MSFLHVIEVKRLGGHVLWLKFDDGTEGEVDLSEKLTGEIFEPLKEEAEFAKARIEGGTVAWPNGADLAPEYLKDQIAEQVAGGERGHRRP